MKFLPALNSLMVGLAGFGSAAVANIESAKRATEASEVATSSVFAFLVFIFLSPRSLRFKSWLYCNVFLLGFKEKSRANSKVELGFFSFDAAQGMVQG